MGQLNSKFISLGVDLDASDLPKHVNHKKQDKFSLLYEMDDFHNNNRSAAAMDEWESNQITQIMGKFVKGYEKAFHQDDYLTSRKSNPSPMPSVESSKLFHNDLLRVKDLKHFDEPDHKDIIIMIDKSKRSKTMMRKVVYKEEQDLYCIAEESEDFIYNNQKFVSNNYYFIYSCIFSFSKSYFNTNNLFPGLKLKHKKEDYHMIVLHVVPKEKDPTVTNLETDNYAFISYVDDRRGKFADKGYLGLTACTHEELKNYEVDGQSFRMELGVKHIDLELNYEGVDARNNMWAQGDVTEKGVDVYGEYVKHATWDIKGRIGDGKFVVECQESREKYFAEKRVRELAGIEEPVNYDEFRFTMSWAQIKCCEDILKFVSRPFVDKVRDERGIQIARHADHNYNTRTMPKLCRRHLEQMPLLRNDMFAKYGFLTFAPEALNHYKSKVSARMYHVSFF